MSETIAKWKVIRQNITKVMDGLSLEKLTKIPEGFNNNLLWNACHVLVTQQLLVYKLSNQDLLVDSDFVERFRKGTFPSTREAAANDLDYFHEMFLPLIDQLEADLDRAIFQEYSEYSTSFGITLHSTEEAISFNNLHESMHLGYMQALKRVL